jgi:hypothetical protein
VCAQTQLPEGDAKEAVEVMCVQCHQIGRVTGMHLSRTDWKTTVEDMVRMGANIPADWVDPLTDYLALNYPEKSAEVSMAITRLPPQADRTPARPLNAVDADGGRWYFDKRGFVARMDSATGSIREWPWAHDNQSPPNTIAVLAGRVWATECAAGLCNLVRFDPAAASFKTWPFPGGLAPITSLIVTAKDQLTATTTGSDECVIVQIGNIGVPP